MTYVQPIGYDVNIYSRFVNKNNPQRASRSDSYNAFAHRSKQKKLIGTISTAAVLIGLAIIFKNKIKSIKFGKSKKIIKNSLMSAEDFLNSLKNLKSDNYDSSKKFMANFHIHTTTSDGKLKPKEVLQQALNNAEKLAENEYFHFSVTDHGKIQAGKEIQKLMKASPEKYKKLKFVSGVEITAKYSNPEFLNKPLQFDILGYGMDLTNKNLNSSLEKVVKSNTEIADKIFKEINELYPKLELSVDNSSAMKHVSDGGFKHSIIKHVSKKLKAINQNESHKAFNIIDKHLGQDNTITAVTPELKDVVSVIKESGGKVVFAHPGRIYLKNRIKPEVQWQEVIENVFTDFKQMGGEGIEGNYKSYKPGNENWAYRIISLLDSKGLKFFKTGGYDTHGSNIAHK